MLLKIPFVSEFYINDIKMLGFIPRKHLIFCLDAIDYFITIIADIN